MNPDDIKISKTETVIKNSLPLIFDRDNNFAFFKYEFGKPKVFEFITLNVKLEYIIGKGFVEKDADIEEKKFGHLLFTTSFTIKSEHHLYNYFELFHEMTKREIFDFENYFKNLKLINYPQNKILTPSLEQVFPIFQELYETKQNDN